MTVGETYTMQTLSVGLTVGDRVTLFEDVDMEGDGAGWSGDVLFEGYVEKYVPESNLLQFEDADAGLVEFEELLSEAEGVQILTGE
jgi:hypothetical protein